MIGYITIGALDGEKSGAKFYDAVLGAIGGESARFADGGWIGYGAKGSDVHNVYVCTPHDKKPATSGNGMMIAFPQQPTRDAVKAAYEAGLKAGGSDEGPPARAQKIRRRSMAPICATPPATRSACVCQGTVWVEIRRPPP